MPFFTFYGAIQEIPGIYLYAWLIGINFQGDAAYRRLSVWLPLGIVTFSIQYPIVVISVSVLYLFKVRPVDVLCHTLGSGKVHWCFLLTEMMSPVVMKVLSTGV